MSVFDPTCNTAEMDLHPDCEQLAFLLGTWSGAGVGDYPTIERFPYLEVAGFAHVGKPFLSYTQRTRHAETDAPLHAEAGYLRAVGGDRIELVLVQPSGIVEVHNGRVTGTRLDLELDLVRTTATAKSVTDVRREMRVEPGDDGPVLIYDVSMAAVGEPMTHHLRAELIYQPQS